jgi:hypothetical protein
MPRFTEINMAGGDYYFELHKAGCKDAHPRTSKRLRLLGANGWHDFDAADLDAYIAESIEEFEAQDMEGFDPADWHIFPCTADAN